MSTLARALDTPPQRLAGDERSGPSRHRRAAIVCALVACLNAVAWSFITPPFQGADEQAHFAYVQYFAETGDLPYANSEQYSHEELIAYRDLHAYYLTQNPAARTIASLAEQRKLQSDLALPFKRISTAGAAGTAASEPPLYYALAATPYRLGSSTSLLPRLELVRLLGALLAGLTAFFVFLFLRESFAGTPWVWTVGALGVAFAPLLGFVGGVVNPDVMVMAVAAAIFYCLARAFNNALTPRLAAAIGALTAVGLLTKLTFAGLLPGIVIGILILALRAGRIDRTRAAICLLTAIGPAVSPLLFYAIVNPLAHHSGLGVTSATAASIEAHGPILQELSYIWQFYLPRLPHMSNDFPGIFTPLQIWFRGIVGKYNWLETDFPDWVYTLALIPAACIIGLCGRALLQRRSGLAGRAGELCVYVLMAGGIMVMLGASSFTASSAEFAQYTEPRYFTPLFALGGAVLALATLGAGKRWGPAVGTAIVLLLLAQDLFSQLLVVGRFYGPI